jgi:hypothetical protein
LRRRESDLVVSCVGCNVMHQSVTADFGGEKRNLIT